jgi:uncharacterized membrane protein YfcA
MTQQLIIEILVVVLTVGTLGYMFKKAISRPNLQLSRKNHVQLIVSGIAAFFMDTIGVGSFACNIALAKYFKTFRDEELPGMLNGAQVLPGAIEALFFLGLVQVDPVTLLVLILGACGGGVLGASLISKLNTQAIRLIMLIAFPLVIMLILSNHFQWLPIGGDKTALSGHELLWGFLGVFVAGTLTSAGVGLFAMVQAVLFCLGMSPLVAFPIMTAAGALQQPLSTVIFTYKNTIPMKRALLMNLYGVAGVFLSIPLITHLSTTNLHGLLVLVLTYNTVMMGRSYLKHRQKVRPALGIVEA